MSGRGKGFAAVMISAVFFGFVPLLVRTAAEGGSNTVSTAFYRFFLSLLPLFFYLRAKKIPLRIPKEEAKHILLITIFGYGGTALLLFQSYNYIPSGMATTLHFSYPVFVILGSLIFLKEKVKPVKILCVGLCMTGIVFFYNGGGAINPLGILLAFTSGITYAFYILYLARSPLAGMDIFKLIFHMHIVASFLFFFLALALGSFPVAVEPSGWVALVILATGAAFIGVYFFQKGVRLTGPQNAAILSTLEPITSLLVGVVIYDELFSAGGILGCILILSSVVIVALVKE